MNDIIGNMPIVNIVLANNYRGSMARVPAMYADQLVKKGFKVIISYPRINHYRYKWFNNRNQNALFYLYGLARIYLRSYVKWKLFKRTWVGLTAYNIDSRIIENEYFMIPSKWNMPNADYILLFQNYLLCDVINFPRSKGEIIDSLHTSNYEEDESMLDWWNYVFHIAKTCNVKRFASSLTTKKYFEKKGLNIDALIYGGVDLDEFKPLPIRKKEYSVLMYVDRRKAKGYDVGIKVLQKIREADGNVRLYAIGNPEGLDTGIFDHVYENFAGEIYSKHMFFLYTSLYDGFPAPPLEAMASGDVCVLPRVAGVDEYGEDRVNCMLCDPGAIDCFVQKLTEVMKDLELCKKLSENAIKTSEHYTWEIATEKLIKLFYSSG